MSPFRKDMNELKQEMFKLKEYILSFKEKVQHIYASNYNSDFGEILKLYTTLENCYELFNTHAPANTNFWIPDELLTPEFSSTDPILSLHESLEYLKKLHDFLTEFKVNIKNLPEVMPLDPKPKIQKIIQPKSKSLRLPMGILRVENGIETALEDQSVPPIAVIKHPEPPTMAKRRRSIDKNLLGNEYVPFNVAIADERDNESSTLINQPSSILPSINISESRMPEVDSFKSQIPTEIELNTANKNATEPISKSMAYESVSDVPDICVPRHNIPPEGVSSIINVQSIDDESEIRNQPNTMQQQTVAEVPSADSTNIDQNALEIIHELRKQSSQRMKNITRLSDSISSNNTEHTQITTDVPFHLKRTKVRKIRDQLVLLPQDISEYQLHVHYFHFQFNVHTQAVIDVILKLRSTLKSTLTPIITQSLVQRNLNDEVEVQLPAMNLTQSQSEVQRLRSSLPHLEKPTDIPHIEIQPDRQTSLQLSTLDNIEQLSIIVPVHSPQISPMPVIGPIVEPHIDKEKVPDASYTHFENLLHGQNPDRRATPKKTELTLATDRKSLRQMSEGDVIKNMERDQYVTLCVLREIRRKYSDSNQIAIQSIQDHFGVDRIGYCKLIRLAIDLQCHDVIRIVKKGNEISGIVIHI